ncbi:NAD(P)-binding protein [Tilletiaria anomala UBC 951]|uniref:NAD(P)-binding protein n=1 Tax=Tilletiaria anomala (strain ATCC 24038 / CBS 436.72 / UBC 951) TaxID=1037660 RepID=A0A066WEW8_TILAU|nr:NAD(P)-binding protein [Tilletiaria anomala UBC 951]KDN52492.1 NAD(P)-binding protein [Tilletiaria anomala UBC 951]
MQIKDRLFYITGAASGLGAASARLLHSKGAYVALLDINLPAVQALARELGSGRAHAAQVDVCSEKDVQDAIDECDRFWKNNNPVVGGVLNAGGVGIAGKILNQDGEPFDLDTYKTVIDINLIGTFNVSRLVAARIVRDVRKPIQKADEHTSDRGVIINTASAAALEGQAGQAAYSASKGGVLAMGLPLARDLAWYGIRVMTLAPALFSTAMTDTLPDRAKAKILQSAEFPVRFGRPDEFAHAVVAIIENEMMNGSYIRLDGATRLGKL